MVKHRDGVEDILEVNQLNYNKDLYHYKALKPLLGRGLVTNDGEGWLHQRHLMQPAFHRKRLTAFGTLMTGATVAMLDRWEDLAGRNQPLHVSAEMLRLALWIAGKALSSINLSDETHTVSQAVTTVNKLLTEYLYTPFPPLNVPTPRNRRLQRACRTLTS